ncbi:MAG: PepSY-like domain-containing protein [Leadbetterella sp.]|nr:PepSY-like domain-containing protein [Leadbetterella sp.]
MRILLTAILLMVFPGHIQAQKTRKIDLGDLPEKAQSFIQKNFSKEKARYILKETEDLLDIEYKVAFLDKIKIKFDRKGNWKEVDGNRTPIPTRFIPGKDPQLYQSQLPGESHCAMGAGRQASAGGAG